MVGEAKVPDPAGPHAYGEDLHSLNETGARGNSEQRRWAADLGLFG